MEDTILSIGQEIFLSSKNQVKTYTVPNEPCKLKCFYNNPTSLVNKARDLDACLVEHDPDVLFFCETWFEEGFELRLENYDGFFKNRTSSTGGGVCIYVKNNLKLSEINDGILSSEKIEQIWVSIKVQDENVLAGCIYRPQTSKDIESISRSLLRASQLVKNRTYSGIIICGDFNFPLMNWDENGLPYKKNKPRNLTNSMSLASTNILLCRHSLNRTAPQQIF